MKNKFMVLGIGIGLLALGSLYLGKKTGLLENDDYLYDEYDTSK
ncbi:methanol dehydrogenase [Enterococcus sp. AZ126]